MKQIKVDGIPVTIIWKKIKSLNLYVKAPDGHVQISAPLRTSDRTIRTFVRAHIDWIYRQQADMRIKYPLRQYVTGETVMVFGMPVTLSVTECQKPYGVQLENGNLLLQAPIGSSIEQRQEIFRHWQRKELKKIAADMLEKWASNMQVQVQEWHIKRMKTKWGSCNYQARRIWLNLALAEQPIECIEYVIVHELCHLLEPSHDTRFWELMTQFLPDWERRRTRLNEK